MSGVSFDEAWNNQIIHPPNAAPNAAPHVPMSVSAKLVEEIAAEQPEPTPRVPRGYAKRARRSESHIQHKKRKVDESESDYSDDSDSDSSVETRGDKFVMQQELHELRSIYEKNLYLNNIVLYASAATVIILLITIFHTQKRLHFTTECLLWYLKSAKVSM